MSPSFCILFNQLILQRLGHLPSGFTHPSSFANIIMHLSTNLIAFVAASLVTSSIAAPVENTILVGQGRPSTPPAPLKCTDPKTGTSPKCWNELKVDEYMEEWHQKIFPAQCKKFRLVHLLQRLRPTRKWTSKLHRHRLRTMPTIKPETTLSFTPMVLRIL